MKKKWIMLLLTGTIVASYLAVPNVGLLEAAGSRQDSYAGSERMMQKGWKAIDKKWYYFDESGHKKTGWLKENGIWYYLKPSGEMAKGWQAVGRSWYYFNGSGHMKTGWLKENGIWYYLRPSGEMAKGWQAVGRTWYYFDGSGHMRTGWLYLDERWYYMDPSGAMLKGWQEIEDELWYFNGSGVWISDEEAADRMEVEKRVGESIRQALDCVTSEPQLEASYKTYPYDKTRYGYEGLTDRQKELYEEILQHVREFQPLSYTAEQDGYAVMDDALAASGAISQDYPEYEMYYWMRDITEGSVTTGMQIEYFMPGDDLMTPVDDTRLLRKEVSLFEAECDEILANMPENINTYDKYRYLATVISYQTQYDIEHQHGWMTGNIFGAIEGGWSICQGYSEGFQYLCKKADLFCDVVCGIVNRTAHAWNLVQLEEGTYHVDITWSDEIYMPYEWGWFNYFMCTQETILGDHTIDDGTEATGTTYFPFPVGSEW